MHQWMVLANLFCCFSFYVFRFCILQLSVIHVLFLWFVSVLWKGLQLSGHYPQLLLVYVWGAFLFPQYHPLLQLMSPVSTACVVIWHLKVFVWAEYFFPRIVLSFSFICFVKGAWWKIILPRMEFYSERNATFFFSLIPSSIHLLTSIRFFLFSLNSLQNQIKIKSNLQLCFSLKKCFFMENYFLSNQIEP